MEGERKAIVHGSQDLDKVRAYLPSNYEAVGDRYCDYIVGHDVAGWTLDGYVIPRLGSGLIFATEVNDDGR